MFSLRVGMWGEGGGEEEIVEKTKQARAVIHLHLKLEY